MKKSNVIQLHKEPRYKLVQMNLKPRTYAKLEELREHLNADNRTETVKRCLDIADLISKTIVNGGRVIIEEKNGTQSKIVLPGLN